MAASRLSISMKASAALLTGGSWAAAASAPSNAPASRKWQWACTSMVLTRLPPTETGSFWRTGCWACALCSRPQLQKTMPVVTAAAPALRKSRRVVMTISSHGFLFAGVVCHHHARLKGSVRLPSAAGKPRSRNIALDRRRLYRKTKTIWEVCVRGNRLPGKSAASFIALLGIAISAATPVAAQKKGGTLRLYHNDNPPSASLLEESTIASVTPFSAVFNNLVVFDPAKVHETLETVIPDLAESWSWDQTNTKLTFQLRQGVKWHDGKLFTARDVQCTWRMLIGKSEASEFHRNPRRVWYTRLQDVTVNGDYEATFELSEPQPSLPVLLASAFSAGYPCHVPQAVMRTKPVGTGPFKRGESIRLVRNPDYFKKDRPYLDEIAVRTIDNRATRMLAFATGDYDITFPSDVSVPLLKD